MRTLPSHEATARWLATGDHERYWTVSWLSAGSMTSLFSVSMLEAGTMFSLRIGARDLDKNGDEIEGK